MTAQAFRKKRIEIEAMQWPDDGDDSYAAVCQRAAIHRWVWDNGGKTWVVTPESDPADVHVVVETLEGQMRISPGDWVIRGVKGEFYPCKPDIFAATYDSANDADHHRGLYRKYELYRVNETGPRLSLVTDPFFILRYTTDPHARVALEAYADSCAGEYPKLAEDLYRALGIDVEVAPVDLTEGLVGYLGDYYQGRWVAVREGSLIAAGASIEQARAGVTDGQRYTVLYVPREGESKLT
ncbi:hypothetical protein [Mycolicibacterium mageritense]|uniref:hypothetical protein n=1 Tax=Mycolicibacterium mageritense TaxID=53462 RepID=UPI001E651BDF|nr:hypothetical protein [Mycolicibacterium mageritense]MCC9182583.1 hypothetical protein [Mycolicibacterium mageritense]